MGASQMTTITAALIKGLRCERHPARFVYAKNKCRTCYGQSLREAHVAAGLCRCGAERAHGRVQCDACRLKGIVRNRKQRARDPASHRVACRRGSARWGRMHPERRLLVQARHRASRRGFEFDIDESDVVVPAHCPVLGIPLAQSTNKASPNSPSLDRIDNTRGYVKGNVWVISSRANRLKGDATIEELEAVIRALRSRT